MLNFNCFSLCKRKQSLSGKVCGKNQSYKGYRSEVFIKKKDRNISRYGGRGEENGKDI